MNRLVLMLIFAGLFFMLAAAITEWLLIDYTETEQERNEEE